MKHNQNPIIFLPGLMGSYGGDMLSGHQEWSFGVAKWVYEPFIKGLEELGYRREENLFICFYDWRKDINEIFKEYLLPMVQLVKARYPHHPMKILAHSMGGLVARCFLQGPYYRGEVGEVLLMGTPNHGALEAYYLWATGQLLPSEKKGIYQIIYRGYIWMLSKRLGIPLGPAYVQELHKAFPGMGQLIPARGYGSVLAYEGPNHEIIPIPQKSTGYQNKFLNRLNRQWRQLQGRVGNVRLLCGEDQETPHMLLVDQQVLMKQGKIQLKRVLNTTQGDGVVTLQSASLPGAKEILVKGTHRGVLSEGLKLLAEEAGFPSVAYQQALGEGIHLIFTSGMAFTLYIDHLVALEFDGSRVKSVLDHVVQFHEHGFTWLALMGVPPGNYTVVVQGEKERRDCLYVLGRDLEEEFHCSPEGLKQGLYPSFQVRSGEKGID